jgi:drug/metabolite transporter (DMT)-like permease
VWGSGGLISKGLIDDGVDSFSMTGLPFLVGGIAALGIALLHRDLVARAIVPAIVLGAVNSAVPALLFNLGYETLAPGVVSLVLSLGPVFTAVSAHFTFADERFSAGKGLGLLVAVAGVAVLSMSPGAADARPSPHGVALVLAGAAIAGATAVLSRRYAMRHGASALVAPQLLAAGLTPLLLGPLFGRDLVPAGGFTITHLAGFALIGLIASYGGFRAIMRANETGTTGQVSVVAYVIPIVGISGGVWFFSEPVTAGVVIGGSMILAAIGIIGRASGKPARLARTVG